MTERRQELVGRAEKRCSILSDRLQKVVVEHLTNTDEFPDSDIDERSADVCHSLCAILSNHVLNIAEMFEKEPGLLLTQVIKTIGNMVSKQSSVKVIEIGLEKEVNESDAIDNAQITSKMMNLVIRKLKNDGHDIGNRPKCTTSLKVNDDESIDFVLKVFPKWGD